LKTEPLATTELILIRHGETDWNAGRRIQGQLDIPLNQTGLAQAQAVSERYQGAQIDVLISSDLQRAMQTMQPIAQASGLPVIPETRLRERHLGILQGISYDDAKRDMPELLDVFISRKVDPIDEGESLHEFSQRVVSVLTEIVRTHASKRIVAVTHGGVVDIACRHATGAPLETPRDFPIHNTSVSTFRVDHSEFQLIEQADISHLPDRKSVDDL